MFLLALGYSFLLFHHSLDFQSPPFCWIPFCSVTAETFDVIASFFFFRGGKKKYRMNTKNCIALWYQISDLLM